MLALTVTVFLHFENSQERIPTFVTEDEKEREVLLDNNAGDEAPFSIITQDGQEIRSNVTALTAYFWNQGDKPIKSEHVLRPIRISFPDSSIRILDFKVSRLTRPVTNFHVSLDSLDMRSLKLSFSILEKEDGASINIIYTGSPQDTLITSGVVEGGNITRKQNINPVLRVIIAVLIVVVGFTAAYTLAEPPTRPPNEEGVVEVGPVVGYMLLAQFVFVFLISIGIAIAFYFNGVQGFIPPPLK